MEQYITSLYRLVETCDYGGLHNEMLRDRLVVSICDAAMSERLQLDPELTLEKAKKLMRQKEAVKEQCQQLQAGVTGSSKDHLSLRRSRVAKQLLTEEHGDCQLRT